jgi:hypothetical protein
MQSPIEIEGISCRYQPAPASAYLLWLGFQTDERSGTNLFEWHFSGRALRRSGAGCTRMRPWFCFWAYLRASPSLSTVQGLIACRHVPSHERACRFGLDRRCPRADHTYSQSLSRSLRPSVNAAQVSIGVLASVPDPPTVAARLGDTVMFVFGNG